MYKTTCSLAAILCFLLLIQPLAWPMQPATPEEIEQYKKDGTFKQRDEFSRRMANHKILPDLARRKSMQVKLLASSSSIELNNLPYTTGLPSTGSPKIFVLPIEFPDYLHTASNDQTLLTDKIFGDGEPEKRPYESLTNYYRRASYNQLNIQGDVFPWYKAKYNRSSYSGAGSIIKEALENWKNSADFTKYDNNNDGKIDYFAVLWTGPDTGKGSLWWGWCDMSQNTFGSDSYTIDGKKLGIFSWQWESRPFGTEFDPIVIMHETGHGLGLPDYYDYNDAIGPRGGLGGMDMMDHNYGDHNAFSKWLLDWIEPTFIGDSATIYRKTLRPSSLFTDAIAIMPAMTSAKMFSEYFLVQNRSQREIENSNDFNLPGEGIVIWHVNAALDSNNWFQNDNSYTSQKLLALEQADGRGSIEQNYSADAGDFYSPATAFTPITIPASKKYSNARTGVTVLNIAPLTIGWPMPPKSSYSLTLTIADSTTNMIGLAEAVDNTALSCNVSGSTESQIWYGQKNVFYYGSDSARTSTVSNGQYATMGTSVTGPVALRFMWKVSSEFNFDFLEFAIDGVVQDRISGIIDWSQKTYAIPSGGHYLTWKYIKDASVSAGDDCAWIDRIECSQIPLAEAVDNQLMTFNEGVGRTTSFLGQPNTFYYGRSAAQSGSINDNESSGFRTTVTGPATLGYFWKVSSQTGDSLKLLLDGVVKYQIAGEIDWHEKTLFIPLGEHVVEWVYQKNSRGKSGSDCGWVDKITCADPGLAQGVDNYILPWSTYGQKTFYKVSTPSHYGRDSVRCAGVTTGQEAWLSSVVIGPGTLKFWWMNDGAGLTGDLDFLIDSAWNGYKFDSTWEEKTFAIPAGTHFLHWKFTNYSTNSDFGVVDRVQYFPDNLTIAEAVDNEIINWQTYGQPFWTPQQAIYNFGFDAAQSGAVASGYDSLLEGAIQGPVALLFDWKVSSKPSIGQLEFYIGNKFKKEISGEVGWTTEKFLIPEGTHTIRWDYYKSAPDVSGSDAGWVDRVQLQPLPPLGVALDNTNLAWNSGGSQKWLGQDITSFYGGSAAVSGAIEKDQTSTLNTTVVGPGELTFRWKIAANTFNYLQFYIDGNKQTQIGGYVDWQRKVYSIGPGNHTLEWRYNKTSPFIDHQDCAWLDKVTFGPQTQTGRWEKYE